MNMGIVRDVMDIIASGYSSTPTGLDRAIASEVINYFYRKGWMNSEDIAWLVEAAGGEIRVTEEMVLGESPLLVVWQDPVTKDRVFRTRKKQDLVDNAKVNPDAEVRVIDSGPINIRLSVPGKTA